ncbi:unnamed protein product [Arctogadus glacialis]
MTVSLSDAQGVSIGWRLRQHGRLPQTGSSPEHGLLLQQAGRCTSNMYPARVSPMRSSGSGPRLVSDTQEEPCKMCMQHTLTT